MNTVSEPSTCCSEFKNALKVAEDNFFRLALEFNKYKELNPANDKAFNFIIDTANLYNDMYKKYSDMAVELQRLTLDYLKMTKQIEVVKSENAKLSGMYYGHMSVCENLIKGIKYESNNL